MVVEWPACGCVEPEGFGSLLTEPCWQMSTTADWLKITHMLQRSSVNLDPDNFSQKEHRGAACAKQALYITANTIKKKNAWTTNGMGMSPKKYPVTSLTCHFPAPWRHLTQGSLSIVCRGYFHWQVSTVNKFLCPKRLNNSFHYSKLPVFLWDL